MKYPNSLDANYSSHSHEVACNTVEELRNKFESAFHRLDSEDLTSLELFELRIELQDAGDTIGELVQHLQNMQALKEREEA